MKTMTDYADRPITVYQDADFAVIDPIIFKAAGLWGTRCAEYLKQHGDVGTCVLGAGIQLPYLPPRCKRYRYLTIISASAVCRAQGSLVWETSVREILAFLEENGVKGAIYNAGNMD